MFPRAHASDGVGGRPLDGLGGRARAHAFDGVGGRPLDGLGGRARARDGVVSRARDLVAALLARMPTRESFYGWRGRRKALVTSTIFLMCAIVLIALDTLSKLTKPDHDYSLELCSIPLIGKGSSGSYTNTFVAIVTTISIKLIIFHFAMFWYSDFFLSHEYVISSLPPFLDTIVAYFGLILSLISSTFSQYKSYHYLMSSVLIFWAFFLQLFLKPKTNFGILSCVGSASFTILTAIIKCLPDTNVEIALFVVGFVLYPFLYFLYSCYTYHPSKDDVYITCLRGSCQDFTPPQNLLLEVVTQNLEQTLQDSPNNLLHLIPLPEKASFQIVSSSTFDDDLRNNLLRSGDPKWDFLRTYYRITIPGVSSHQTPTTSFPSPTLSFPSHTPSHSSFRSAGSLLPSLSPDEESGNTNKDPTLIFPLDPKIASSSRLDEGTSSGRVGYSRIFGRYGQS